jgi:hypothetical protein
MDMATLIEPLKKKYSYERKRIKREERKSRNKKGNEQAIVCETESDKNIKEEPKEIHTHSTDIDSEAQNFAKMSKESSQIILNSDFNSRLNNKQKSENNTQTDVAT